MKTKQERLDEILEKMNVPDKRKGDLHWLNRNVWIQNDWHPDIKECCNLVNELLIEKGFKNAEYIEQLGNKV